MAAQPIKIFNAFDLQFGCTTGDNIHVQETIDYCEVRFRDILSAFGRANHSRQRVIQRGLHKELVNISIYIYHIYRILTYICRPLRCPMLGWQRPRVRF